MPQHDNALEREEEHEYTEKTRGKRALTGYELFKCWYSFASEVPVEIRPIHHAIMAWVFELYNLSGKAETFQLVTKEAIAILGINHPDTYQKAIKQLVAWGCLRIVKEARGTYVARWVSLKECPVFDDRIDNIVQPIIQPTVQPKKQVEKQVKQRVKQQVKRAPIIKGINKEIDKYSNNKGISDAVTVVPDESNSQETLFELITVKDKKAVAKLEKEYTLTHRIRLEVEKIRPEYRWYSKDGKAAKTLCDQIKFRFSKKNGREPSDEELLYSFTWLIDHLPSWYANKWDLPLISGSFEKIMLELEKGPVSGGGKKPTMADSMATIERAGERLRQQPNRGDLFEIFGNF